MESIGGQAGDFWGLKSSYPLALLWVQWPVVELAERSISLCLNNLINSVLGNPASVPVC